MYYSLKVPASECSAQSHELLLEFVTDLYSWKYMYFPLNQRNIIRTQLYLAKNPFTFSSWGPRDMAGVKNLDHRATT